MASSPRRFRLVVYDHHLDPHILRDIVADVLKLHAVDAMRIVSHAPGVLPYGMTRVRAQRLGQKLASVGVHVGIWPVNELPNLSAPCLVHKVDCRPDAMVTFGLRGEPFLLVPWPQVELVSVGEFPRVGQELSLSAPSWLNATAGAFRSIVMGHRRATLQVSKPVESAAPELWLVRSRPIQVIRLQQAHANYEYLGDRLAPSTRANFRSLIEDVLHYSSLAIRTPATESFLAYERPGSHHFASAQQFMEYTTWQLLLRWRDRPRPADEDSATSSTD